MVSRRLKRSRYPTALPNNNICIIRFQLTLFFRLTREKNILINSLHLTVLGSTGSSKRNRARIGQESSLLPGCRRREGNSNRGIFFCTSQGPNQPYSILEWSNTLSSVIDQMDQKDTKLAIGSRQRDVVDP